MEENYLINASEGVLLEHGLSVTNCRGKKLEELVVLHLGKLLLKGVNLLQHCTSLKFCTLADNYITDISALQSCVHLVKLDLHGNQIQNIPGMEFWRHLKDLKLLYLHNNRIGNLSNVQSLSACPALLGLTLYDTPLSLQKNYRHIVVNSIWSLKALDHFVISDEEIIEDWTLQGRFKALSPELQLNIVPAPNKEISVQSESKDTSRIITKINCILASSSPVLIVQKWIRGYLVRRRTGLIFQPGKRRTKLHSQRKRSQEEDGRKPLVKSGLIDNVTDLRNGGKMPAIIQVLPEAKLTHELRKQNQQQPAQCVIECGHEKYKNDTALKTSKDRDSDSEQVNENEFSLSGLKAIFHESKDLLSNEKSARDIRASIREIHSTIEAKRDAANLVKDPVAKRRSMQHSHLVNLLPLYAIDKAYENQKKNNKVIQKRNLVVQMQADKKQGKYRIEEFLAAKRKQTMTQNQIDCEKLQQSAQYNLLDKSNMVDNVKYRHKQFLYGKEARKLENISAREFNTQHTSVTKTLMRHDRLIRSHEEVQGKMKFVQGLKEDQEKQKKFIRRLQEHRQLVLQVENASEKFALDSLILQKANGRLQDAQGHVTAMKSQHVIAEAMDKVPVKQPVPKETYLKH
ncbi:PREDICTED: leucine-rich repeat and IQ domain-containing protein 3 [Nanorana parkeri]|uniref:leucine-rich repeat and IQ domain-containing protein 3 n=1 Tax=Nanorana parkeri TaxID=125878 RepID=UPI000854DB2D|nr:PREDICTED: leucine-rich repeat and IQ domain-containing protein 3 [Nanorana parkeri]